MFDKYTSQLDPGIVIIVKHDDVPPFRFKAGGWEFLETMDHLGPAMTARIEEAGFFMCRMGDEGWTELLDLPPPRAGQ